MYTIWLDGDACPKDVRRIVFKASERVGARVVMVADRIMPVPQSPLVEMVRVRSQPDEADRYILSELSPGDIVISADIPLAYEAVKNGAVVIDPRGQTHTADNVAARLSTRNLMKDLRDRGIVKGGPPPLGTTDTAAFANALDRILTKKLKDAARGRGTGQNRGDD